MLRYKPSSPAGNNSNGNYGTSDTSKRPKAFKDYVEEPIKCRHCGRTIIGEYNFDTGEVITYEIDKYPKQRIEHEHPADVITRTDIMHRMAVEIRYLRNPNPDDLHVLT